jgi:A/G-specific adenine glycosylase
MGEGEKLVAWYRRHGRKLPWRRYDDPYRVWLAEVMLQQTRTAQALPYYLRFLEQFPTLEALAAADDAAVMKLWEGMGYYGRARNLLACAREVATRHGGRFPDEPAELEKLKGVGPYTARAIAAFAYGKPYLALDGNGMRVLARYYADPAPIQQGYKRRQALGDAWVPPHAPADFNNAVMDLGATVCTPRKPRCGDCPLNDGCAAYAAGIPERFPLKAQKSAPRIRFYDCFFVRSGNGFWVRKRPENGIWGGLWELPTLESDENTPQRPPLFEVKHVLTHVQMRIRVYVADALPASLSPNDLPSADSFAVVSREGDVLTQNRPEFRVVTFAESETLAFPKAMRTICRRLQKGRFHQAMF